MNNSISYFVGDGNFPDLLEEFSANNQKLVEGTIVKAVIIDNDQNFVVADVGTKSAGYAPMSEFDPADVVKGNVIDVLLEKLDNGSGNIVISHKGAKRYASWCKLKECLSTREPVSGKILGRVKGGFAVDIVDGNIIAFLPRSQVDVMVLSGMDSFIGSKEDFIVLKMDDARGNIVISRKALLDNEMLKERDQVLSELQVGDILDGVVKNITDYGAFIDTGKCGDGLMLASDMSWRRLSHPTDMLSIGQKVRVCVTKFDKATKRISLGMKQLEKNPWDTIEESYPVGKIVTGRISNMVPYGAFISIGDGDHNVGLDGLAHITEYSWLKNDSSYLKLMSVGQEINVMILDVDVERRRISLGIKQCEPNPWKEFSSVHKVGETVSGVIKTITNFGAFAELDGGVDGLIHISDLSYNDPSGAEAIKKYKKNDCIKVVLLGSKYDQERISLGIKQLDIKDFQEKVSNLARGCEVECVVLNVRRDSVEVELNMGLKGTIRRSDVTDSQKIDIANKFPHGSKLTAKVLSFNDITGRLLLTLRDLEDENNANSDYIVNSYSDDDTHSNDTIWNILNDDKSQVKSSSNSESAELGCTDETENNDLDSTD